MTAFMPRPDPLTSVSIGQFIWVHGTAHPSWPAMVIAEDHLPPTALVQRPSNADETYPVFYLGTYEYGWVSLKRMYQYHVYKEKVTEEKKEKYPELRIAMEDVEKGVEYVVTKLKELLEQSRGDEDDVGGREGREGMHTDVHQDKSWSSASKEKSMIKNGSVEKTPNANKSPYDDFTMHGAGRSAKSNPSDWTPRKRQKKNKQGAPDAHTDVVVEQDAQDDPAMRAHLEHIGYTDPLPRLFWKHESVPKTLIKYWHQRYDLFSLFDKGILIDEEGWYSVTPEKIAWHIAQRCYDCLEYRASLAEERNEMRDSGGNAVVVDAFCGVGGNAIQFARIFPHVIAIDVNPVRLLCAKRNAEIYGVADRIEFILGDATRILPMINYASIIFFSPPWGGPSYLSLDAYRVDMIPYFDFPALVKAARRLTDNVVLFMPRTLYLPDDDPVVKGDVCEVEMHLLRGKEKCAAVYFGDLVYAEED